MSRAVPFDCNDFIAADPIDKVLDQFLSHFSQEIINSFRPKPVKDPSL